MVKENYPQGEKDELEKFFFLTLIKIYFVFVSMWYDNCLIK